VLSFFGSIKTGSRLNDIVHIVYQSLFYFEILAVVVIVGSYVSYKIRRKLTGEKFAYEKEIEEQEAKKKKLAELKAQREKEKLEKAKRAHKKSKAPIVHTQAKSHIEVKKKIRDDTEDYSLQRMKKKSLTKTFVRQKRLEVLTSISSSATPQPHTNVVSHSQTPQVPPVQRSRRTEDSLPQKKKKLHSLDDDILGKYADDDADSGLYTLKVKKSDD